MDKGSKTWGLLSRGIVLVGVFLLAWWFLASTVELGAVLREIGRVRLGYVSMASVLSLLYLLCGALALFWGLMGGLGLLAARSGGGLRSGVKVNESND